MWFVLAAIFTRLVSGDPWQWCFAVELMNCPWPGPFLSRITALMGSMVAGAFVNPDDQRWPWWPLLPLSFQFFKQV